MHTISGNEAVICVGYDGVGGWICVGGWISIDGNWQGDADLRQQRNADDWRRLALHWLDLHWQMIGNGWIYVGAVKQMVDGWGRRDLARTVGGREEEGMEVW